MSTYYSVYITPRADIYTYGTEIDVSDLIDAKGISAIKVSVDSTDFEMGAFKYSDLTLKGINRDGYFNDETDKRSIFFPFSRDLAKVRVVFTNSDGDNIVFKGLINEEATKLDFRNDTISFRVLSLDSVIRNTQVAAGTVSDGTLVSVALETILNTTAITSVLTFDDTEINPAYDFAIDHGAAFDNISTRDALNLLLVASNSVMTIDSSDTIIIRDRDLNEGTSILNLYGPYDEKMRQNALDLKDFNTGKHRMFNSFLINSTDSSNNSYIEQYGFRQKAITMDFITDSEKELAIGETLLDEFKLPKLELSIEVPTYVAKDCILLDPVSINWPLRIKPYTSCFFPVIGDAKIGDTSTKLPFKFGSLAIDPGVAFKIIEINHNPATFITTLKLRQSGVDFEDGYFRYPASPLIGFAVIGRALIGGTGTPAVTTRAIGHAVIGTTGMG